MKIKYLNYSQAKAICNDYQYLVGRPYENTDNNTESNNIVHQVVTAPYSRILQWQFMRSVVRGVSPEQAIEICPNGRYDVLVLPEQDRRAISFRMKSLRSYLSEHGIDYNQEIYNCLRIY